MAPRRQQQQQQQPAQPVLSRNLGAPRLSPHPYVIQHHHVHHHVHHVVGSVPTVGATASRLPLGDITNQAPSGGLNNYFFQHAPPLYPPIQWQPIAALPPPPPPPPPPPQRRTWTTLHRAPITSGRVQASRARALEEAAIDLSFRSRSPTADWQPAPPDMELVEVEWSGQLRQSSCPICLKDFRHGEKISHGGCGHIGCTVCLKKWLERNNSCPLCRKAIGQSGGQCGGGGGGGSRDGASGSGGGGGGGLVGGAIMAC